MNEPLDDLIQRVLEGSATAGERASLAARLEADPAARVRHDELARVFDALGAARMEPAPAGLREGVLRAIRAAAPARTPARAGRPAFRWARVLLPAAAGAIAALVLVANWQGAPRSPGDRTAGTMAGAGEANPVRIGSGPSRVEVSWSPAASGFEIRVQAGDAPVRVTLESRSEGTRLNLAYQDPPAPSASRVEADLSANAFVIAEGTARGGRAAVRVGVTFPDGRQASGDVQVRGLRPTR